ncbi:hypothetical protein GF351_01145 [Candidatus Woesearchaeota archaeon]|nr:hypothetical protein [Candidatus Woesearchaeota archaeon]
MVFSELMLEVGVKILMAVAFVVLGSLVLREVAVKLFRTEDTTMGTASAVMIWTGVVVLFFSFFQSITWVQYGLAAAANVVMILLVRKYYKVSWKTTAGIWAAWACVLVIASALVAGTISIAL